MEGHHRVEALRQTFGDDYKVEVTLVKYNDEQMLKGMVIENLTQRADEMVEVADNLAAVKDYLKKNKIMLDDNGNLTTRPTVGRVVRPQGGGSQLEYGTTSQISLWLDKGKGEKG